MLHISFPGVVYSKPESPAAIRRALMLLEDRLRELETPPSGGRRRGERTAQPSNGDDPVARDVSGERDASPASAGTEQPKDSGSLNGALKPGRWFRERWPRVSLPSGERLIPRSLEELRGLVAQHGIRPHKRGDAAMLLWQVRHRLGLDVDIVGRPPD
ncbi:MAG: hypothetical protein EXR48_04085 [Dehalococcoidia bacterium]|nr:hypothetical protein [Dehalococcoidia bacterium]